MARIVELAKDPTAAIAETADAIEAGKIVVIPTDTVYGLAAAAFQPCAVAAIYRLKERDPAKPLVVMAACMDDIMRIADTCSYLRLLRLAPAWPGPLTAVALKAADPRLEAVAGGSAGIGLRIPEDAFARRLLRRTGPLAVTSVNKSGGEPVLEAREIPDTMAAEIAVIVDAGRRGSGVPSTVVDLTTRSPLLLRQGELSAEMLEELLGEPVARPAADNVG
ncbi:MAG: L-threonylcarbamoyladenylate synthase [Candidatus Geothermincolia bacterium]